MKVKKQTTNNSEEGRHSKAVQFEEKSKASATQYIKTKKNLKTY